jgi:hypothetical protein
LDTKRRHAEADVSQQPTRCDYSGILRLKDLSAPTSLVFRSMVTSGLFDFSALIYVFVLFIVVCLQVFCCSVSLAAASLSGRE